MGGNGTEATTVLFGGALVTVLLYFFGPELAAWRGQAPTPEQVASMTTVMIVILAVVLPHNLLERVMKRTRRRRSSSS